MSECRRPLLYFSALTLIFFSPLLWGEAFLPLGFLHRTPLWYDPSLPLKEFDIYDAIIATYPYQYILGDGLSRGEFPFWSPYNFGGFPVAFSGQSGYFYPPRILLSALLPIWLAHGLSLAIHIFVAGFAAWLLARRVGLTKGAAYIFGTAWMFNPFVMGWLQLDVLNICAAYTPLALLAVDRCRTSWRWSVWLGLILGCFVLGGHLQFILYSVLTVIVVGLMVLWEKKAHPIVFARLSLAAVLAVLFSAPMLLPTGYYLSNSQRPEIEVGNLNAVHRDFVSTCWSTVLFPEAHGNGNDFAIRRIFSAGNFIHAELIFYFGIVTLVLALLALTSRGVGRWMMILAFGVLLLPTTPLYSFVQMLPGLEHINATRSIQIIHFLVAFSAGFGANLLVTEQGRRKGAVISGALGLVAFIWAGSACSRPTGETLTELFARQAVRLPSRDLFLTQEQYFQAVIDGFEQIYSWTNPFVWLPILCFVLCTAALLSKREPSRILLVLLIVDLFSLGRSLNPHHPRERLYPDNPEVAQIQQAAPARVMGVSTIKPNTLAPLGVLDVAGYDSFYPKNSGQFLAYLMFGPASANQMLPAQVFPITNYSSPLVDLLGVKLLVAYPGQELEGKTLHHRGRLWIYSNPTMVERAVLVDQTLVEPDNQKALQLLDSGQVDPRRTAILSDKLAESLSGGGEAQIQSYEMNEVVISVEAEGRSFLVLTDGYASGWEVEIDGQPAELMRADVMFRGVVVPEGRHVVRFIFRPRYFRFGLALACAGILGAMLLLGLFRD